MLRWVDDDDLTWIPRFVVRTRRLAVVAAVALLGSVLVPAAGRAQQTDHPDLLAAIEAYNAGELQQALDLLQAAPALLNRHDSAIRSLYAGLIRYAQGETERARQSFAQAVRAEPSIRLDPAIHSPGRIAVFEAARVVVGEELRLDAQAADREGNESAALQAWQVVLDAVPEDEEALGRVAALRVELRGDAMRRQAELLEEARTMDTIPPPVAEEEPEARETESSQEATYSPGRALAMGLVVPGLGEFYTGRTTRGILALGAAGGVLAAGLLSERLEVDCRSVPEDGVCPPADVLDERTIRPYLAPSIAVAAGIAVVSAIDAYLAARNANGAAAPAMDPEDGGSLRLLSPALTVSGGRLRADLLRLRFR